MTAAIPRNATASGRATDRCALNPLARIIPQNGTVEVPADPQRIASISYFAADVAFALGIKLAATTYMAAHRYPDFLLGLTKSRSFRRYWVGQLRDLLPEGPVADAPSDTEGSGHPLEVKKYSISKGLKWWVCTGSNCGPAD